jgi:hypothetical protein
MLKYLCKLPFGCCVVGEVASLLLGVRRFLSFFFQGTDTISQTVSLAFVFSLTVIFKNFKLRVVNPCL